MDTFAPPLCCFPFAFYTASVNYSSVALAEPCHICFVAAPVLMIQMLLWNTVERWAQHSGRRPDTTQSSYTPPRSRSRFQTRRVGEGRTFSHVFHKVVQKTVPIFAWVPFRCQWLAKQIRKYAKLAMFSAPTNFGLEIWFWISDLTVTRICAWRRMLSDGSERTWKITLRASKGWGSSSKFTDATVSELSRVEQGGNII